LQLQIALDLRVFERAEANPGLHEGLCAESVDTSHAGERRVEMQGAPRHFAQLRTRAFVIAWLADRMRAVYRRRLAGSDDERLRVQCGDVERRLEREPLRGRAWRLARLRRLVDVRRLHVEVVRGPFEQLAPVPGGRGEDQRGGRACHGTRSRGRAGQSL